MNIIKDIEYLINKPVDPTLFPVKKGNKIFVGNFVVKQNPYSYTVYNEKNQLQGDTESKLAAIALAKTLNKNRRVSQEIHRLDRMISKNLQDSVFYDNVYRKTQDTQRKLDADMKLCNARSKIKDAEEKLCSFIFPKKVNNYYNRKLT